MTENQTTERPYGPDRWDDLTLANAESMTRYTVDRWTERLDRILAEKKIREEEKAESYSLLTTNGDWFVGTSEDSLHLRACFVTDDGCLPITLDTLLREEIVDTEQTFGETYCLLDAEGDWWVGTDPDVLTFVGGTNTKPWEYIATTHGVDTEQTPQAYVMMAPWGMIAVNDVEAAIRDLQARLQG